MVPHPRRLVLAGLLAVACLGTSGCIWLRLLDLKNQLADFDRRIDAPADAPRLTLVFRKPVLLADDVVELLGNRPSATTPTQRGEDWLLRWVKTPVPDPAGGAPLTWAMDVDLGIERGKVASIAFPEQLDRVVPRPLALAMLRSMGKAKVDRANRRAESTLEPGAPGTDRPLPKRADLVATMGPPVSTGTHGAFQRLTYTYDLQGATDAKKGRAAVHLDFGADDTVRRFEVALAGLWFAMDYPAR